MKIQLLITAITINLLLTAFKLFSQSPCLPEGITFTTQTQIDSFRVNYPGCTEIEGDVYIGNWNNPTEISNLEGLNLLTYIGGELWFYNNDSLINMAGLENIEASSIDDLYISGNSSLSTCEVESVCAYLANPIGDIAIYENATGCNSPEEVLDSCEANAVRIEEYHIKDILTLYPNPARQELNISVEGLTIEEVTIYTLTGQQMIASKPKNKTIDISSLQSGMYIMEVIIEGRMIRQKLLVQR